MSSTVQAAMLYVKQHGPVEVAPVAGQEADRPLSPQELALGVVSVRAGWHDPQLLEMRLGVLRMFHINSNRPAPGLVATEIRGIGDEADVESVEYPAGEPRRFAFADDPIDIYEGEVRILVRFNSPKTGKPPVRLALQYQACDENSCLPPVTKRLEIPTP